MITTLTVMKEIRLDIEQRLDISNYANPLYDIGKIAIPDTILLKPAKLTENVAFSPPFS